MGWRSIKKKKKKDGRQQGVSVKERGEMGMGREYKRNKDWALKELSIK